MTERNQRPAISTVKSRTPPGRYRPGDQPRPWKPALEDREDHQRPAINAVKLAHHHTEVEVLTTRLRCPRPPWVWTAEPVCRRSTAAMEARARRQRRPPAPGDQHREVSHTTTAKSRFSDTQGRVFRVGSRTTRAPGNGRAICDPRGLSASISRRILDSGIRYV